MGNPTLTKKLIAALILSGDETSEHKGHPSMEVCLHTLVALDNAGCGDDVPDRIRKAVVYHLVLHDIRITDRGVEWAPEEAS